MADAHSTSRTIGSSFPSPYIMQQQTFLGCSIAGFNVTAGFGDTSSQLSVDLAVDSFNIGDSTPLGQGHDVYHDGAGENGAIPGDRFRPPPVGTPVFFTFGRVRATVEEAFQKSFDDYYYQSHSAVPTFDWTPGPNFGNVTGGNKGHYHFTFGGILQAYTQTQSPDGGTLYNVVVTDPREILSNCVLILNNYAGSTANNPNLLNIYGFLEHDTIDRNLQASFDAVGVDSVKKLQANGAGTDVYYGDFGPPQPRSSAVFNANSQLADQYVQSLFTGFPVTGTGMSRRTDAGIPYYRVAQAFNYMMGLTVNNPLSGSQNKEYFDAGYGGYIYFRGLKYVVDLSGLPTLPYHYRLGYDQMNLLELIMEICDATNHEIFVTLLPVIDHPACAITYNWNNNKSGTPTDMIAGIIKVVTINKSIPPRPGKIKEYLDSIPDPVMVKDFGYELTNEPTDKFITGGDEVEMYYFTRYQKPVPQFGMHKIEYSYQQQILPYYGKLAPKTVTIPRGFGSYQQIVLDAGSLLADGVGKYYVATEIELRAAAISFEKWLEFLLQYNDKYMESIEGGDIKDNFYARITPGYGSIVEISNNYAITVPRCVCPPHPSEDGFISGTNIPLNPCHPPYGWPLYWQRATNIGVPMAGSSSFSARANRVLSTVNSAAQKYSGNASNGKIAPEVDNAIRSTINTVTSQAAGVVAVSDKISRQGLHNVKIIYNFLKNVADECLGKKFLVKIPQEPNKCYHRDTIILESIQGSSPPAQAMKQGPFGFMPRDMKNSPIWSMPTTGAYTFSPDSSMNELMLFADNEIGGNIVDDRGNASLLRAGIGKDAVGALKIGYNKANQEHSFNYLPEPEGGWYTFSTGIQPSSLLLAPIDDEFLKTDNGRIKPYIRYDHSHIISLSSFPKDSYSQQFLDPTTNRNIPDLSYVMENSNNPSDKLSETAPAFQNQVTIGGRTFTPVNACAFVKVDLDPEFYFAPRMIYRTAYAYGNSVDFTWSISEPQDVLDHDGCKMVKSYGVRYKNYFPLPTGDGGGQAILDMDLSQCWDYVRQEKPKHVYALITLPDRAVATMTTRFRDGMNMQVNAASIKHYLQLDVVRGMPGITQFQSPPTPEFRNWEWMDQSIQDQNRRTSMRNAADEAVKKAYQGMTYDLSQRVNIISPSPIYPDLVALPLRSVERCYGPWLSAYRDYEQIGGKMEFIHDETLVPWNYGGYNLMDKAGRLMAEFGTSASLMNERGGFTIPSAPSGYTLGTYLLNLGPLVTNISTKVDSAGISTTVSMDIYTASFGKMQKQKSDNIKQLSRLKQQITDERNAMHKRNMGKGQKSASTYPMFLNMLRSMDFSNRFYSAFERGQSEMSNMIGISCQSSFGTVGANALSDDVVAGTRVENAQTSMNGGFLSPTQQMHGASMMNLGTYDGIINSENYAQANITDIFAPYQINGDSNGGGVLPGMKNSQLPGNGAYGD